MPHPCQRPRQPRGFTLLEVLIAVAILGLSLTAILSAQMGSVRGAAHARNMNQAAGLLRCKMTELEEQVRVDGYQELDIQDSGPCCEGDDSPNITCEWSIEKPMFPEASFGELNLDADLEGGDLGAIGKLATGTGADATDGAAGDIGAVADSLGGGAAGAAGGLASMVMGMVYPSLKQLFEASSRRLYVKLTWYEGERAYEMDISQWVTSPQQGQIVGELPDDPTATPGATPSPTPASRPF